MGIAIAIATMLLALLVGVLLAAFENAPAMTDTSVRRTSLIWVIATSLTGTAALAYALFV